MLRFLFLLAIFPCYGAILPYLKPIQDKEEISSIEGIDCIYLINLDTRPEKYRRCLEELFPYGVWPNRFPAIYGWHLPFSVWEEIGVKFRPGMWTGGDHALYLSPAGYFQFVALGELFYDKTVFSSWLTPGGVGCTLSHLSILQDAEQSGYETIWILEDDIVVAQDPHVLTELIRKLDEAAEGWDILYTDPDYLCGLDETRDLQEQVPMKWRPDMPDFDLKILLEHTPIGDDFYKIGNRNRTHSMIFSRRGVQKILNFYREHGMFMPYDHELGFIPEIQMYVLKKPVIDCTADISDTKDKFF